MSVTLKYFRKDHCNFPLFLSFLKLFLKSSLKSIFKNKRTKKCFCLKVLLFLEWWELNRAVEQYKHIFWKIPQLFSTHSKIKTTQTYFLSFVFKTQNQFFQFKKQCEKNCYSNKFFGFFIFKNQKQFLKTLVK